MRLLRGLSGLTIAAACMAGCANAGEPTSADAAPQFVQPTPTIAETVAGTPEAAAASSVTPSSVAPSSVTPSSVTPSSAKPSAAKSPSAKPSVEPSSAKPPSSVKYVFPIRASNVDYHPTHGKYPATDLFADCGKPVVATTSGVVLEVSLVDRYVKGAPDGPYNGGLSVSIKGDDGVRYYVSHLTKVQSGIRAGVRVKAGQQLGTVGKTGNANNVCHLHYGSSPPCAEVGDWKVRRGVIWPASYLDSWRKGGNKSPVGTVMTWKNKNNCKA